MPNLCRSSRNHSRSSRLHGIRMASPRKMALTTTDQMQIAHDRNRTRRKLRACIARNPNTYPALLEWLAQLNDPAINAALRTRQ